MKTMQVDYDDLSSEIFRVPLESPVLKWERVFGCRPLNNNLEKIKQKFQPGLPPIIDYSIRIIPKNFKRNRGDSAKVILIITAEGTFGKRHNNSQWLSLDF